MRRSGEQSSHRSPPTLLPWLVPALNCGVEGALFVTADFPQAAMLCNIPQLCQRRATNRPNAQHSPRGTKDSE